VNRAERRRVAVEIKRRPRQAGPVDTREARTILGAVGDLVGLDTAGQMDQMMADLHSAILIFSAVERLDAAVEAAYAADRDGSGRGDEAVGLLWQLAADVRGVVRLSRSLNGEIPRGAA
jgi:hypothetical protein